jgi:hypothetical protein
MAEGSETARSRRRWNIIVAAVLLAIIIFAVYSCSQAGLKESPAVVPLLLAAASLV